PWHPLCGRSTRCVLIERRASGEIAQLELEPGVVTMVAAWKLDPVYCGAIKVGLPQVSLAALSDLHRLLMACESRLLFANGNTVTQEDHDGIAATARTSIGTRSKIETCATPPARPRSTRAPRASFDPRSSRGLGFKSKVNLMVKSMGAHGRPSCPRARQRGRWGQSIAYSNPISQ